MKRLRQVALVLGSVFLSSGLALGQAKLGPHVVDSNGQRIGYYAGLGFGPPAVDEAIVFIDGVASRIQIGRDGFVTADVFLYFENADCSGVQYVRVRPDIYLVQLASYTTDGFFHYTTTDYQTDVITLAQRTLHGDGTLSPCDPTGGQSDNAAPYLSSPAPAFTPPFLVVEAFPVSPAPAQATFNDVPTNHPFFQFIEALYASGITAGCQAMPPLYCPDSPLTRGQMAVFLAKALGL